MQRTAFVLVFVAVVASAGVAFAPLGAAQGGGGVPPGGFAQKDVAPDDVLIEVAVEPDGDAVWETQYRVRLASDDEEQAFEDLRAEVASDPDAYATRFGDRMRATADVAENATGREMTVTNVTVEAERRELPQSYGVLTYRFEWENFAAVTDDRIRVGDSIDALFLDDATSLIVSWEEGYRLAEATPSPTETRDRAVVWEGPVDFTEGSPRVTVVPEGGGVGAILLGAVGLLVAIAAVVGYRRRSGGASPSNASATSEATTDAGLGAEPATAPDDSAGGADEPDEHDDGPEPSAAETGSGEASPAPVDDLLSNEEQVLRLIEEAGGRMKQKRVAEELEWTAAKTSQVVTGLREADELDGFRLGRENVLSLPGYDAAPNASEPDDADADSDDADDNE